MTFFLIFFLDCRQCMCVVNYILHWMRYFYLVRVVCVRACVFFGPLSFLYTL